MRYCPLCKRSYEDNSYEFCLEDGTRLAESSDSEAPTVFLSEEQTQIRNSSAEQPPLFPPTQAQNYQQSQVTQISPPVQYQAQNQEILPETPKSNTARTIFLTAFGMILLFGTGFGAWYFITNKKPQTTEHTTVSVQNKENKNTEKSPTPKPSENVNATTPKPTPKIDTEKVKEEVSDTIYGWKDATEAGDIDDLMNYYGETVDFYGKQTSRSAVRNAKQDAFNKYDTMNITISNLRVTPDESGEKATAVFDKEWFFSGEKIYEGKVQSQFQLTKSGGSWRITSEKDLKVYYVEK